HTTAPSLLSRWRQGFCSSGAARSRLTAQQVAQPRDIRTQTVAFRSSVGLRISDGFQNALTNDNYVIARARYARCRRYVAIGAPMSWFPSLSRFCQLTPGSRVGPDRPH